MMIGRFAVGVVLIALAAFSGCGERTKKLGDSAFQVAFESHNVPSQMQSGKTVSPDITVKNISPATWPSKPDDNGRYAVHLSYHWFSRKGEMVVPEGLRTSLPADLKPGESVQLKANIQAPEKPGKYMLEVTLVQENNAWFPQKDGGKLTLPVAVREAGEAATNAEPPEKTANAQPEAAAKSSKPSAADERATGSWSVQLGSFAEKKVAANLAAKLKDKGYDAYVTAVTVKGKEVHRVRVGHFANRADAEKLRETLRTVEKQQKAVVISG